MNWTPFINAFKDANGDFNLAEGIAAVGGISAICIVVHSYFVRHESFSLLAFAGGLSALIMAVAGAQAARQDRQRLRDLEGK
jgi:hypothetical protein